MAAEATIEMRTDPWSEDDFLALPVDRRVELLDGSLLVSPSSSHRHQWLSSRLWMVLNAAAPRGLRALEAVNVRVGPDRILIPDLAVVAHPRSSVSVTDARAVGLVVEITSPTNAVVDRVVKPALYAEAGIPRLLRIEFGPDGPVGHLIALDSGAPVEIARGTRIGLDSPFAVALDLAELDDLDE